MNREVKEIVEYLEENREQIYGLSYYPDDVLTSRELIMLMDYINQLENTLNEVRKKCETNIRMFDSGKSYSIAVKDTSKDILKILDKVGSSNV